MRNHKDWRYGRGMEKKEKKSVIPPKQVAWHFFPAEDLFVFIVFTKS